MESTKFFSSHQFKVQHKVLSEHAGMRLDQFLSLAFKTLSRSFIAKKIVRGDVKIEGRVGGIRSSTKLQLGQIVEMITLRENLDQEYWKGELLPFDLGPPGVVYEDNSMVVIDKPPFMSTHPTGKHLFYCATVVMDQHYPLTRHLPVHRLDRETSGLLVMAKDSTSANLLAYQFEMNQVKKCYFFIAKKKQGKCLANFTAKERLLNAGENSRSRIVTQVFDQHSIQGKSAETSFQFLYQNNSYAVGFAFPKTGRQHQIRAHAAHHGFPLVGDKLYLGGTECFVRFKDQVALEEDYALMELPRHALHAYSIEIPSLNKKIQVRGLPKDLVDFLDNLDSREPLLSQNVLSL